MLPGTAGAVCPPHSTRAAGAPGVPPAHVAQIDPGEGDAGGRVKRGHEAVSEVSRQPQQRPIVARHQRGVLQGCGGCGAGRQVGWRGGQRRRTPHACATLRSCSARPHRWRPCQRDGPAVSGCGPLKTMAVCSPPPTHLLDEHVCRQQAAHGADGQLKHMHPHIQVKGGVGRQPRHRVLQLLPLPHDLYGAVVQGRAGGAGRGAGEVRRGEGAGEGGATTRHSGPVECSSSSSSSSCGGGGCSLWRTGRGAATHHERVEAVDERQRDAALHTGGVQLHTIYRPTCPSMSPTAAPAALAPRPIARPRRSAARAPRPARWSSLLLQPLHAFVQRHQTGCRPGQTCCLQVHDAGSDAAQGHPWAASEPASCIWTARLARSTPSWVPCSTKIGG